MREKIDQGALAKKVLADYKAEAEYRGNLNKIKEEEFKRSNTGKFIGKLSSATNRLSNMFNPSKISSKKTYTAIVKKAPTVTLTKSQSMINELFNGEKVFGTGNNLPQLNNALNSGGGLIKHDDMYERRTGRMFGLR
jgi:hypothetical protein